jgi:hypothetical protein
MSATGKQQSDKNTATESKALVDSDVPEEKPTIEALFDAKAFLKNVTSKPGVYRMLDVKAQVIYVGKAKNLKKRLSS